MTLKEKEETLIYPKKTSLQTKAEHAPDGNSTAN